VNVFEMPQLLAKQSESDSPYLEFLKVPALSSGVYVLEPGANDYQKPHAEDELYFVASGRARMIVDEGGTSNAFDVGPGSIIYVRAGVRHSFYQIAERLVVLVFFAPAEGSHKTTAA
jgi:mannose-6-phosphate isomerase-like protein (cupin superfamily)